MRSINKPPFAPTLMESTRAIGYSLEAAIADIIDNSITAKANRVDVNFFPIGESYISILDNGIGMSEDELISSMEYGSKNPNDKRDELDLGRYGLGLKTASLSQCSKLTVISIKNDVLSGCRWDLEHIYKVRDWNLLVLDDSDFNNIPNLQNLQNLKNGTLVLWQNLDKLKLGEANFSIVFGKKMDVVREHISLVFHRFLSGEKKMEMFINNLKIEPKDPFLVRKSTQVMDDEKYIVNGQLITVRAYTLPHISKMTDQELKMLGGNEGLRKRQGFYVYRNKRLLVWGTWFRLMRQGDLSKLARVQVDIPNSLDDLWTLDIKKSTATPPEEVRENLAIVIANIAKSSKRTWTHRGKKEIDDKKIHFWNRLKTRDSSILYEINKKHPMVEKFVNDHVEIKNALYTLFNQIENSIPLNSLYIDLTNDEKVQNETNIKEIDALELLKSMLLQYPESLRIDLYEKLQDVEPFCNYLESINEAKKRGELF